MKLSVWLLLACSLAGAIPLHTGESWTWLVVDGSTNAHNWRSATVLDSAKHDSGVAWRIQARDSLTKGMDTGSILVRPNGWQSWMTLSKFLPWEPGQREYSAVGIPDAGNSSPLPWGVAFLSQVAGAVASSSLTVKVDSGLLQCGYDAGYDVLWRTCPEHLWDFRVGVLRARFHGDSQEDWILQTHNGKAVAVAPIALAVPEVGATLVWQESTLTDSLPYGWPFNRVQRTDGPFTRTWKVLEQPTDSGDWVRVRILETIRSDSSRRDSAFDLRMNALTGERLPARGKGHPAPDEGWWRDWSDQVSTSDGTRLRRVHSIDGWFTTRPNSYKSDSLSWMKIGSENQIDSLVEKFNLDQSEGAASSWDRSTFTRILLSVNDKVIRDPDALGVGRSSRRSAPFDLPTLACLHPNLAVHWRDARGRSGQILASDLNRSWNGAGSGVLFLSAVLPDGSSWTGIRLLAMH